MPKLQQILSPDSEAALESIRYTSDDVTTVADMNRTQLYLHFDIREKLLKAQHGPDWQRHADREFAAKRELWSAARDWHEAIKAAKAARRTQ